MKYGICIIAVTPLRAEANDRAEMVSQLLFGEAAEILETKNNWVKIKADFDGYEGWTDVKSLEISDQKPEIISEKYAADLYNLLTENDLPTTLPIAADLSFFNDNKFELENKQFEFLGDSISPKKNRESVVELAHLFLNIPYLWGGKTSFGIDCSGFVQQVYKMCGVKLPRDAWQQANEGNVLSFVEEAEPGDLAFFDNEDGKIIHVGFVLENKKIIHAHGKVRIDLLDSTGIFNVDSKAYSHKLRFIRSLF